MEVSGERRGWARRRREHVPGGRRHAHLVKVSPEEEAQLRMRADALGVSVPRLLVEAALAEGPAGDVIEVAAERAARQEVLTQMFRVGNAIGAVGVNINQMAKATNATGETPEEVTAALAHLRTVLRAHGEFMDEFGRVHR